MPARKIFTVVLASTGIVILALLFGQILGGYYIYNLLDSDNLPETPQPQGIVVPAKEKVMVLRLDPITFYTVQIGIYSDGAQAQEAVNKLLGLGYRPFVSNGPPYRIWVSCFGEMALGKEFEQLLKNQGFEAFIGQGIINDRALRFPENNQFIKDSFAPLLREYNLLLGNALKMFKGPQEGEYNLETWGNMINKMQRDTNLTVLLTENITGLPESQPYREALDNIKSKANNFSSGLSAILEAEGHQAVITSQSQLLEFIGAYHHLIGTANVILDTD